VTHDENRDWTGRKGAWTNNGPKQLLVTISESIIDNFARNRNGCGEDF